tara:strand:+ start:712 stop:1218 length:507 start_codon:yes stop_codon:yes gene_type:complete
MIITLGNKEFVFNKVSKRSNNIVFFDNIFNNNHLLTSKLEIDYDFFIDILKLSLRTYVNCNNKDRPVKICLEELFQYFKITNNNNVKKDVVSKIGYLLINNQNLTKDTDIFNLFSSLIEKSNINYKSDNYFKFIILLFRHENNDIIEELFVSDNEYFDILDFIIDYYE